MSNYWKDHYDQNTKLFRNSLCKQVGKTVSGSEINQKQLDYITESITGSLHVGNTDTVIDLCCGNGLITRNVAGHAREITGIDFSKGLIKMAKTTSYAENIIYIVSDVLQVSPVYLENVKKFYMYEAIQHFTVEMFTRLLELLGPLEPEILLFIGSVPDEERLWYYYNTEEKKQFYLGRERENRPHMGKWWKKEELRQLSSQHGFSVTFIEQNPLLYTSDYRFDCLLEKTGG